MPGVEPDMRWCGAEALAAVALGAMISCATAPPPASGPAEQLYDESSQKFNPAAWAIQFTGGEECEKAAEGLASVSGDRAWQGLRACVTTEFTLGRRFIELELLTRQAWAADLGTRPDAPTIVAALIARRGGDIAGDLAMFATSRLPVMGLQSAMTRPDDKHGRLVMLHARPVVGKDESLLEEVEAHTTVSPGSGAASPAPAAAPAPTGHKRGHSGTDSGGAHGSGGHVDSVLTPTGKQIVLKLPAGKHPIVAGHDYIILATFDGVNVGDGGAVRATATYMASFEPPAIPGE